MANPLTPLLTIAQANPCDTGRGVSYGMLYAAHAAVEQLIAERNEALAARNAYIQFFRSTTGEFLGFPEAIERLIAERDEARAPQGNTGMSG